MHVPYAIASFNNENLYYDRDIACADVVRQEHIRKTREEQKNRAGEETIDFEGKGHRIKQDFRVS